MEQQGRQQSRLSTFTVFKSSSKPPPPPPKDRWYLHPSASAVSLSPSYSSPFSPQSSSYASSSHDTLQVPQTPITPASRQFPINRTGSPAPSPSMLTSPSTLSVNKMPGSERNILKKGLEKLSLLGKRSFSKGSSSRNVSPSNFDAVNDNVRPESIVDDGSISFPWNFQHHLHVDESLGGLPPTWLSSLRSAGLSEQEIMLIYARRQRQPNIDDHPDVSPESIRPNTGGRSYSPSITSSSVQSHSTGASNSTRPDAKLDPVRRKPPTLESLPSRTSSRQSHLYLATALSVTGGGDAASLATSIAPSPAPSQTSFNTAITEATVNGRSPPQPVRSQFSQCSGGSHSSSEGTPTNVAAPQLVQEPAPIAPTRRPVMHVVNPSLSESIESKPPSYKENEDMASRFANGAGDVKSPLQPSSSRVTPSAESDALTSPVRVQSPDRVVITPPDHEDDEEFLPEAQEILVSSPPRPTVPRRALPPEPPVTPPAPPEEEIPLEPEDASAPSTPQRRMSTTSSSFQTPQQSPRGTLSPQPSPMSPRIPAPIEAPRLSLHALDSDISSWSDSLFSAIGSSITPETSFAPSFAATSSSEDPFSSIKPPSSASPTSSPPPISPPYTSPSLRANRPPSLLSRPEEAGTSGSEPADRSNRLTSPWSVVEGDAGVHSPLSSPQREAPDTSYDFLSHDIYEDQGQDRRSERDSQATISASSRWSRGTTIRHASIHVATRTRPAVAHVIPALPVLPKGTDATQPSPRLTSNGHAIPPFPSPKVLMRDTGGSNSPSPVSPTPISPMFSAQSSKSSRTSEDGLPLCSPPFVNSTEMPAPTQAISIRSPSPDSTKSGSASSRSSASSSQIKPFSIVSSRSESPVDERSPSGPDVQIMPPSPNFLSSEPSMPDGLSPLSHAFQDTVEAAASWGVKSPARPESTTLASFADEVSHVEPSGGDGRQDVIAPLADWVDDSRSVKERGADLKRDSSIMYGIDRSREAGPSRSGSTAHRPSIRVNGLAPPSTNESNLAASSRAPSPSPVTPDQRYVGWVSEVVEPLQEFINDLDPRELFTDLQEIAESESGSVCSAKVVASRRHKVKGFVCGNNLVAIKTIPLLPSGCPKMHDIRREQLLMCRMRHENILSMDAFYVDTLEDSLWIKMELMQRSLADILALVKEGLEMKEANIARFTGDILNALSYLQENGIAHRDVRSDNLLLNDQGILKLADFSSAVQYDPEATKRSDVVGVIYWQAPEMRAGPYDVSKVDVWSLGATVWEMAESDPPFSMHTDLSQLPAVLPPLSQQELYSEAFHQFILLCNSSPRSRPDPPSLITSPFISSASPRSAIVKLLTQCRDLEEKMLRRQSSDSQGTVLA